MGPTLLIRLIIGTAFITQFSTASFGYKKYHQYNWPRKFQKCGGIIQSPISLSAAKSIALPLPALEMVGFHNFLPHPLTLTNNGHTVRMNVAPNSLYRKLPYVFGAMLNKDQQYELESLHFHWGLKNNRGSEHVLNDVRYPMEMHVIHRNKAYLNMERALSYADGLVVLGIFFQLQDVDNENLNPILNCLPSIQRVDTEVILNASITLSSLMPKNTETYYTYRGSLTTPPCSETITWIIFSTPTPISFNQIGQFRKLSNGAHILADNYRTLQHIGLRKIYVRKLTTTSDDINLPDFNVTDSTWFWH